VLGRGHLARVIHAATMQTASAVTELTATLDEVDDDSDAGASVPMRQPLQMERLAIRIIKRHVLIAGGDIVDERD
jgi:hypothetical protein